MWLSDALSTAWAVAGRTEHIQPRSGRGGLQTGRVQRLAGSPTPVRCKLPCAPSLQQPAGKTHRLPAPTHWLEIDEDSGAGLRRVLSVAGRRSSGSCTGGSPRLARPRHDLHGRRLGCEDMTRRQGVTDRVSISAARGTNTSCEAEQVPAASQMRPACQLPVPPHTQRQRSRQGADAPPNLPLPSLAL